MKCAKDPKDVPNLQVKSRKLLSQFLMPKRREGKRMVLLSDLFAQHVKARTDLRLDKPVHEIDARCAYCVREIQQAYARSDILQPTFTDHDYFPIVSPWLCESCAIMFQFGLQNAPNAWSFLAYGTGEEFSSYFPWDVCAKPWYATPRIRPLLAVAVDGDNKRKHTVFRGKVCYDEDWIIVWKSGLLYAPSEVAEKIMAQEAEWQANGYPAPKQIAEVLMQILTHLDEQLQAWTYQIVMTRRQKETNSNGT